MLYIEIINDEGRNAIVSCIYRTPDSHMVEFNKDIESYLNEMRSMNKNVYLCGDFSIDLLKCSNHNETKEFIDVMYGHGFYPLISKPTRVNSCTATLIDNIFTNKIDVKTTCGIFIDDITDHFPVFMLCNKKMNASCNKCTKVRDASEANILKLYDSLVKYNWDILYRENDVNEAYKMFLKIFMDSFEKYCPVKMVKVKHNMTKPCFTVGLKAACRKKNLLYKKYLKTKSPMVVAKYKSNCILRLAEKEY